MIKGQVRRLAKGLYWIATPWKMPQRMEFFRARAATQAEEAERDRYITADQVRRARLSQDEPVEAPLPLSVFDDDDAGRAAELPVGAILWPPLEPAAVIDESSAARYCIDLWRRRSDIRSRFADGPAGGIHGEFGTWIIGAGVLELGLPQAAVPHLRHVLASPYAKRARQHFLTSELPAAVLPHGLTPPGTRLLFRWFMRIALRASGLRLEEVWWLFLEAEADPARELLLAYAFSPEWQALHPDALNAFGREAFLRWFALQYGTSGAWLDPRRRLDWMAPEDQIRLGFWTRPDWRAAHPEGLSHPGRAAVLLSWLSSPEAGSSDLAANWLRGQDHQALALRMARPGANVIGHFCYASGLRVSVESMVEAMHRADVQTSLRDVWTDAKDDPFHVDYRGMECHDLTIIHTQPEPFFKDAYSRAHLFERSPRTYRIAYWYWEFDTIPDEWADTAQAVDEVWVATEFVARGLRAKLKLPVRTLFPGVKLAPYAQRGKKHFGLAEDCFTFLFTFHMMSVMERKNPLGLISAFRLAFGPDDKAQLVLKTSFGDRHPDQLRALRDAAAGARIVIIDEIYDPDEVLSLMDACDAYVSLHRSEGLGLTIAEAMLMGKPVVATHFSGNVDFMNESNSLPVRYRLVKLERPIPPYDAGLEWAEPSAEHAAELMRKLYDDPSWAREVGERGRANAEANLSLDAAGRRIATRIEEIRALRH